MSVPDVGVPSVPPADAARRCPRCGSEVAADDQFCEACGAEIFGAAPPVPAGPPAGEEAPIELSRPVQPTEEPGPAGSGGAARPQP